MWVPIIITISLLIVSALVKFTVCPLLVSKFEKRALLPISSRTSYEDWIQIFREIVIAADGELSPELARLLDNPSAVLIAGTQIISDAKAEAECVLSDAKAETERLLAEARAERAVLLDIPLDPVYEPAANWLPICQRSQLMSEPSRGDRETIVFVFEEVLMPSCWTSVWQQDTLPRVRRTGRSRNVMRVTSLTTSSTVTFTFWNCSNKIEKTVPLDDIHNLFLTELFFGNRNCLPEMSGNGLPFQLTRVLLDDLPTLQPGLDVTLGFALREEIVRMIDRPECGISHIKVSITAALSGQTYR